MLNAYHGYLIEDLMAFGRGGPKSLSYDELKRQYDLCRLDFFRHMLTRGWVASSKTDVELVERLGESATLLEGI